jgi:hypothetical protein
MNVLINHCWCSDSNWGGNYNCRVIVTIPSRDKDKGYYDPPSEDWKNLIEEHEMPQPIEQFGRYNTWRLKPEVMEWLEKNIPDRSLKKWQIVKYNDSPKGWAVGTDKYNSNDVCGFNVFFESYRQAAKFIKQWSVFGKPVDYLNYFKDIRMELDITTNKLKRVKR